MAAYRCRGSLMVPLMGSSTVRHITPLANPMLTYCVDTESTPPVVISMIAMDMGWAGSACRPMGAMDELGSSENMRTVPSYNPTAYQPGRSTREHTGEQKAVQAGGETYEEEGTRTTGDDGRDLQTGHLLTQLHLLRLDQGTGGIQLKVDQITAGQRHHHLPLVDRALDNVLAARCPPLVDALVGADVPDAVRVHLHQGVVTQQRDGQRRGGGEQTAVGHLFHGLADGQHDGGVHKRHHDVLVVLV